MHVTTQETEDNEGSHKWTSEHADGYSVYKLLWSAIVTQ